jgi:hypothetical protein
MFTRGSCRFGGSFSRREDDGHAMDRSTATLLRDSCATCEAEITGRPVFRAGLAFCCSGCVAGGPCTCSYDADPTPPIDPGEAATPVDVRHCLDVRAMVSTPE